MSFINSLISLSSNNPSTILEGKKHLLGLDAQLDIQKIAYAFFLDSYKPQGDEKKPFDTLSKYDFYGASLSGNRLCQELNAFLKAPMSSSLHEETRQKLTILIKLLQEAQKQSDHVDLLRSSSWRLILLPMMGDSIGSATSYKVVVETEQFEQLVTSAIQKIQSLQIGEKAFFLAGTSIHDTLICVERNGPFSYKFSIYDSANVTNHYTFSSDEICNRGLWKKLYSIKFLPPNEKNKTDDLAKKDKLIQKSNRENCSELRQRRQTCHLRCFLAFLKDQIIGQSSLEFNNACAEWKLFKKIFGEFLLNSQNR